MTQEEFVNRFGITIKELQDLAKLFVELIGDTLDYINETTDNLLTFTQKFILKLIQYFDKSWGKAAVGLVKYQKTLKIEAPRKKDNIRALITYEVLMFQTEQKQSRILEYSKYYV